MTNAGTSTAPTDPQVESFALQPWYRVDATFKPQRTDDLKPDRLPWIGYRGEFTIGWMIDDIAAYEGDGALMQFHVGERDGFPGWAPSRDFEIHANLTWGKDEKSDE